MPRHSIYFILSFLVYCSGCISQKPKHSLRVCSYNIRHGEGMDGKIDIKRIAVLLQTTRAELIALQEVDKNCARSGKIDIAKDLAKLLGMNYHFEKFMNYDGGEYGMAILSKFPINKAIRHDLPKGSEPRCAIEIQVQTPYLTQTISFVNIHNEWNKDKVRLAQTIILNEKINRPHPIILAGDFNGDQKDAALLHLNSHQWLILQKSPNKTWPSDKPETEIDFIMTRQLPPHKVEHHVIDEAIISDHRPIFAEFEFLKN
jgi:endonuclease/exonuclease/phosphatase family metal-dependent hydrolase